MIYVYKDYKDVPYKLRDTKTLSLIHQSIQLKNADLISHQIYSHSSVKEKLEKIYYSKCAYCESYVKHVASLEVEHYRPKKMVKEDSSHNGYYWLGFIWSNLLLSCPKCNGQSSKGNKFPIQGNRVYNPPLTINLELDFSQCEPYHSPLIDEKPLLLNPEIDFPEEHLKYNSRGEILGTTHRGKTTVKICNLDRLNIERQKFIDDLWDFLKKKISQLSRNQIDIKLFKEDVSYFFVKKIYEGTKPDQEFSGFKRYMFKNLNIIIQELVMETIGNQVLLDFLISILEEIKQEYKFDT